jgi:hypothetical protein
MIAEFAIAWPPTLVDAPAACFSPPPVRIRVEIYLSTDVGPPICALADEAIWLGDDINVDLVSRTELAGRMAASAPDESCPPPTPTKSTITVRFAGDPEGTDTVLVPLDSIIHRLMADGVNCTPTHSDKDVTISSYSIIWPLSDPGLPAECRKAATTRLRFEFRFASTLEVFAAEAVWTGGDLEVLCVLYREPSGVQPALVCSPPSPYPQSTVTVRFVQNGMPVVIQSLSFPKGISADGVPCLTLVQEFDGSQFVFQWPAVPSDAQPSKCEKGPPTTIGVQFSGSFGITFLWSGQNVLIDAEVPVADPELKVITPGGPTITPVALPPTGGQP